MIVYTCRVCIVEPYFLCYKKSVKKFIFMFHPQSKITEWITCFKLIRNQYSTLIPLSGEFFATVNTTLIVHNMRKFVISFSALPFPTPFY
jgi:hypothetical protein